MMRILILALCLSILGCGDNAEPPKAEEDKANVFDPLLENLDKAKAVEQQLMDQKDQLDRAINAAEAGGSETEAED